MKTTDKTILLTRWLDGQLTDDALKKALSDKEYAEFIKLKNSFDLLGAVEKKKKDIWHQIDHQIAKKPAKTVSIQSKKIYRWAFTSVAAVLIIFLATKFLIPNPVKVYSNNTAQNMAVLLPDGSQVVLMARSEIKFNPKKWSENREVILHGRAFFKVKKGQAFDVKSAQGIVSVLGTRFEVSSLKDLFQVICYEGKVKVLTREKNSFVLTPGMGISIQDHQLKKIRSIWAEPDWLNHIYTYKKQPLGLVLDQLSKIYKVRINTEKIDTNTIITGGFPKDNLDISLQAVLKPLKIGYTKNDQIIELFYLK